MGRLAQLGRHAAAAWEVPRDLLLGRYPPFVTGGPLPAGHVPVFCFHGLEPVSFERKLRHLSDNGYVTLSADEYFELLTGARPAPARAVVLTFDDARATVRSVGLPLMRRYGLRGLVFVIPGRTSSRPGPLPPTLDDVSAGRASVPDLLSREDGPEAFLSWEELSDMATSDVFDFGSHSLSHARVHTSPRVETFMHPGLRSGFGPLDAPLVHTPEGDRLGPQVPLGTPLLQHQPRLSDALRFYEDAEGRRACVERVAAEGEDFFRRRDWERVLRATLGRRTLEGRYETPAEHEAAVLRELREARRQIEARIQRPALDLCYPWHVAGPTARRAAREIGHRSAYCGKGPAGPVSLPGSDPHAVARIGEDYVELLPGRGRRRLLDVLQRKWTRRLGEAFP